ncbi:Gfo/Idh/MocA family protein [Enterovibrio norvegicus]|uniref:Oxidoreductase n=1 Tax=Enterovibrio norvegicus TaxID=188144 RepID=A0A2N7L5P5_9GAMM|nr:Gfo/Idh/MocA family oxidoreductase [Enterovibrio norvegicus]PML80829.1 oxidoreductase [Enterovibrio norvegicus]PMN67359.1 oxidoreductase [Enterovibrio norvegicus]PMN88944.1 oxidoreductase [Enterovibrio norvegicus]
MIKDRKIRIAVVGCGRISKNHFGSIESLSSEYELVAVCDTDTSVLKAHREKYKVPGYSSIDELIHNEDLDLVTLCTPSGLHATQTLKAAEAKINVITEKPMATKWEDGLSMVRKCDEEGVKLFVVKQNRRNSTLQLLKRAVTDKRFGQIYMVHLNVFWTRPQEYYDRAKWSGTWDMDGGAFMNQATHYVDLLHWLIGPVETVHAMTSTHRDIEVEDTGVVNIRWRNGSLGSMAVTMCTYPKNLEGSISILGEKGTVRIGGVAVNDIQEWSFEDKREYDSEIEGANYQTSSVYGFGHPPYFQNVADVLRGKAEAETDGREGLKSLELLISTYRSARDHKEIHLPLNL